MVSDKLFVTVTYNFILDFYYEIHRSQNGKMVKIENKDLIIIEAVIGKDLVNDVLNFINVNHYEKVIRVKVNFYRYLVLDVYEDDGI